MTPLKLCLCSTWCEGEWEGCGAHGDQGGENDELLHGDLLLGASKAENKARNIYKTPFITDQFKNKLRIGIFLMYLFSSVDKYFFDFYLITVIYALVLLWTQFVQYHTTFSKVFFFCGLCYDFATDAI